MSLIVLSVIDVGASALLALVFAYLFRLLGGRHLKLYAGAWGFIALGQVPVGLAKAGLIAETGLVSLMLAPSFLVAVLLLRYGTIAYLGRQEGWSWAIAAVLAALSVPVAEASGASPHMAAAGPAVVMGFMLLATAATLWRPARTPADKGAALALGGIGLHLMDYPLLGGVEWFYPIGVGLSILLQVSFGCMLIVATLENQLRRSRDGIARSHLPWFAMDREGLLAEQNHAFHRLMGFEQGDSLLPAFPSDAGWETFLLHAWHAPLDLELALRSKSGRPLRVQISGRSTEEGLGERGYFEAFVSDRTAERQLQGKLELSGRFEALGRLAGGIAHDFNNLLTAIQCSLELGGGASNPNLDLAMDATKRAAAITEQLLGFARRDPDDAQVLDIAGHLTMLGRLLQRTLGAEHRLTISHEGPGCQVLIPPSELDQIVMNLVLNGRDAMGPGGEILVHTRFVAETNQLEIRVQDAGSGMDEDTRLRAFDPLFTTKSGDTGTGLGLSIVRDVVIGVGGSVSLSSVPGEGTTVVVHLPAELGVRSASATMPPVSGEPTASGLVLVVDDDVLVRRATAATLRAAGLRVIVADGETAARAVRVDQLAALVTDVALADGNGLSLALGLRALRPDLPVLFVSGHPDEVAPRSHLEATGQFLPKPYSAGQLTRALTRLLRSPSGPPNASRPVAREVQ